MLFAVLRTALDRFHNLSVPRAPAKIPPDMLADLFLGGPGIFVQQGLPHDHHTGGAKSALNCAMLQERFLNGMELAIGFGNPFDRHNLTSIQSNRQCKTGQRRHPIEKNRTRAALSDPTGILRTRQP